MTESHFKTPILIGIWLLLLSGFFNTAIAQCEGSDGSITICEKDSDTNYQTFDLFTVLNDSPDPGGIWSTNDPANFFALDRNTGIVNLWEITNSGVHQFTYTTCGASSVATINLGGYPGEENIDGSADACGDNPAVNLHSYIGDNTAGKFQDFNGIWAAVTPSATAHLNENIFDAQSAGPGVYEFTHTVPAVDTCPSRQIRLILEVQRPANAGLGTDLVVCANEDLSGFTNYDLDGLLIDEDINGTWSEEPATNELDDLTDHFVNIEQIRDNNGPGTYSFLYTVFPSHAICAIDTTSVNVVIQPVLQGTLSAANYCRAEDSYTVDVDSYDTTLINNGTYEITYEITSSGGVSTFIETTSMTLRNDGTGSFDIDATLVGLNQTTMVTITSLGPDVCPDVQVPSVSFVVSDPMALAMDSCENQEVPISLSTIFDATGSNANGDYDINYRLTAPSGSESDFSVENILFTDGSADFAIPASQITETGDYGIRLEPQAGFPLDCTIEATFTIAPIPSSIDLDIMVDNSCDATAVTVSVDAPMLGDGAYDITYDVLRENDGQVVISNAINFTGGEASYDLEVTTLEQGNYIVNVRSTQNDTTPCRLEFDFEINEGFAISGIPERPIAEAEQELCLSAFVPDIPTLMDIEVTAEGDLLFYATETDMDILPLDTPLVDGEDYFISSIDPSNNCEGSERTQVTITLSDTEMPTASNSTPLFCAADNPTINSLNDLITSSPDVQWFSTETGGTALESTLSLTDGTSYFAATRTGQCLSTQRLEIIPVVISLEPASLEFTELALCALDQPTVSNLRDLENDTDYEVYWYADAENGVPLLEDIPLTDEMTYYAESFNRDTGCVNPQRIAVTVDLNNCDPADYGFFIPDGFSPNNDGKNDTYYIPNIETIFPEYSLKIINRYGSVLFTGNSSKPAWDGDNAPNGVYFYVIDYNREGFEPVQGTIYLNR